MTTSFIWAPFSAGAEAGVLVRLAEVGAAHDHRPAHLVEPRSEAGADLVLEGGLPDIPLAPLGGAGLGARIEMVGRQQRNALRVVPRVQNVGEDFLDPQAGPGRSEVVQEED